MQAEALARHGLWHPELWDPAVLKLKGLSGLLASLSGQQQNIVARSGYAVCGRLTQQPEHALPALHAVCSAATTAGAAPHFGWQLAGAGLVCLAAVAAVLGLRIARLVHRRRRSSAGANGRKGSPY